MIAWGPKYELGIAKVDAQHRVLVMLINRLETLREAGAAAQRDLEEILKHLDQYVRTHFADEERMLDDLSYTEISEHIEEHRAFEARIAQIRTDLESGRPDVLDNLVEFLGGWLTGHILENDRGYVDEFRDRDLL
ncbi:MAG: bacteriohemerythrin [Leptospirales bacterium]|jgi:hemerythrin-like metal-binding protein